MSQENVDLVRRWFAFLARGELPLDVAAENVEIDNIEGFPVQGPYSGHSGMQRWWDDLADAFETFRIEMIDCAPLDDERVLSENQASGRFRGTGIPLDFPWASLITIREGKVVRAVGYFSRSQALEELGLSE
jgi:ketosteroid isomerase-like protein